MVATFFDTNAEPPLGDSTNFSLQLWKKILERAILPLHHSGLGGSEQTRIEFLAGAKLLGFGLEDYDPDDRVRELTDPIFAAAERQRRIKAGYLDALMPQQLLIADTLAKPFDAYAIEISRRAAKTTTIFMVLLGRCAMRPGYQVTFSAQSGIAGSRRFREWAARLDMVSPPPELKPFAKRAFSTHPTLFGEDQVLIKDRGFTIMRGEVGKGIYFTNGSSFLVLKPEADAYRGEAADCSWIDEAQELDPVKGDDVLAAILPLQDTKPGSSIILSGTAGEARIGPFWSYLDDLQKKAIGVGGLDYAAPADTEWAELENEAKAMELLTKHHPGIGTLTTLEKMIQRYRKLPRPQWAREYLSIWPETAGAVVIPAEAWQQASRQRRPTIPERVAFGLAIKPGGSVAAIVAAWRNSRGVACVEVVEHRPGTNWIPKRAQELTKRYRGSTIAYDDISEGKATATEMQFLSPKPRLRIQTYRETAAGCVQILRDIYRGKLNHYNQAGLDAAVKVAAKREIRNDQGIWVWTIAQPEDDITCLDAATKALRNWDQHFAKQKSLKKVIAA